jgi:hypothetical protein
VKLEEGQVGVEVKEEDGVVAEVEEKEDKDDEKKDEDEKSEPEDEES